MPPLPTTTTTPGGAVLAWSEKYLGNIESLNNDEENINVADDELEQSIGGSAPLNYGPILAASQQLASDVATDQGLPPVPDATAESDWTADLGDLAVSAADLTKGFTDNENGDTTDGPVLIQQAEAQMDQATIQQNNLESRISVAESS